MLVIIVRERKGGFSFAGDFAGSKGARECFLFAFFVLAELWAIGVLGGVCMELLLSAGNF